MKIDRINILKYGKFSDQTFELNQPFTILLGENETGKSTLLNAILDCLYGIKNKAYRPFDDSHSEIFLKIKT